MEGGVLRFLLLSVGVPPLAALGRDRAAEGSRGIAVRHNANPDGSWPRLAIVLRRSGCRLGIGVKMLRAIAELTSHEKDTLKVADATVTSTAPQGTANATSDGLLSGVGWPLRVDRLDLAPIAAPRPWRGLGLRIIKDSHDDIPPKARRRG